MHSFSLAHWLQLLVHSNVLTQLVHDLQTDDVRWEIAVLVLSFGAAWGVKRWLKRRHPQTPPQYASLVFPMVMGLVVFCGQAFLSMSEDVPLLKLSMAALIAWFISRYISQALTDSSNPSPTARWVGRGLRLLVWMVALLVVTDGMGVITAYLDTIDITIGKHQTTLESLLEGAISILVLLFVALVLSRALERRLMRASFVDLNLRLVLSKLLRGLFLIAGLLIGLPMAGIDLTVLSVFTGAIGVGLGLGLQRLAANYVSGFVLLLERSIKVGDMIRVDGFEGQITGIRTRYSVVRAPNGRESVVPNEMMTSTRVENLSLADTRISIITTVTVGYDSDPQQVIRLLCEAAASCPRVLSNPGPAAFLQNFAPDGLDFLLSFWVEDPHNGQLNLKSDVNLAVLAALRQAHIDIPYPQRVVHQAVGK